MKALPAGSFDMLYADPPFFTGCNRRIRGQGPGAPLEFDDSWAGGLPDYLDWLRPRLQEMMRLLTSSGSLFVHLDWHAVHHVKCEMDRLFGPER
ncbi:MAG: hypothetical protein HY815_07760, partial [Candidatus Riflebacteria bacterium]|nr:hypothetical protein [Candidatus Riflebacteria bacterium]